MKLIFRTLSTLLILLIGVVLGVFVVARFHDGPLEGVFEIVAAGPFDSGEMQTGAGEPDWAFLKDYSTVEFQLLDPIRSRTTWRARRALASTRSSSQARARILPTTILVR